MEGTDGRKRVREVRESPRDLASRGVVGGEKVEEEMCGRVGLYLTASGKI
jgi:hypothetical protein